MLGLCERFHCLPSQLYKEDADLILMMSIEAMGRKGDTDGEQG